MKSSKTPPHLKPHLSKRATNGAPGVNDHDMEDPDNSVDPMAENAGQLATQGQVKRDVSRGGVQLDKQQPNPLMKRAMGKKAAGRKPSAFFGDYGPVKKF